MIELPDANEPIYYGKEHTGRFPTKRKKQQRLAIKILNHISEVINIILKKKLFAIICAAFLVSTCIGLSACGKNDGGGETQQLFHDSTKWFTEEELSAKGLSGLPAPTGLSGVMNSSDAWFNDGY